MPDAVRLMPDRVPYGRARAQGRPGENGTANAWLHNFGLRFVMLRADGLAVREGRLIVDYAYELFE